MKSKPLRFKILLAAIAVFCVLCVAIIAVYSPIIFQRGNPIPYLLASAKLDDNTPYVQVEQTDSSCVYITKRGVSDEVLKFFAESTGAELQERYGDTYIFSYGENRVIVESETYWRYYTVWELPVLMDTSDTTTLLPGTTYVSNQCIYMNPLSSYAAVGGDSGCKYVIGENYFATINRTEDGTISLEGLPNPDTTGSDLLNMIDVPEWEWQEFPYTDEEWAALYIPEGFGMQNISEIYDEILYQPLSNRQFLLRVDDRLWLVELRSNQQMGTYLWSIYSLVPESAMGVAQWEYAPMLSSRCPYFRFAFDMEYTQISAVCIQSALVDFDAPGRPSDVSLILREGNALYWSPVDEDGNVVTAAIIHFIAQQDNDVMPYSGTIYIEGNSVFSGRMIYTASIVGTGLHLDQNSETEGGVISAVENSSGFLLVDVADGERFIGETIPPSSEQNNDDVVPNYFYGYYEAYIISLSDDSTYYCWCMLYNVPSERGTWTLNEDIVCLTGDGKDEASSVNYFKVDGNDLVFIAENSTGFSFMDIADGARIIGR